MVTTMNMTLTEREGGCIPEESLSTGPNFVACDGSTGPEGGQEAHNPDESRWSQVEPSSQFFQASYSQDDAAHTEINQSINQSVNLFSNSDTFSVIHILNNLAKKQHQGYVGSQLAYK